MIKAQDIIAKRRRIWEERHDIECDRELVRASVRKILSDEALVKEYKAKPYLLIETAFCIVNKKRETVPFFFNEVQSDFICQLEERGTTKPYFILKGRQQGFTSLITAMQLSYAIVRKNFSGFTMADRADNTQAIFNDKARVVYDRLPEELKPHEQFNSRNELFFDKLNSSWRIATATDEVGRSRTLEFVHFSEAAFYKCGLAKLQTSIGETAVSNALIIYETTAHGFNEAKDLWDSGACNNIFYEWWRTQEYRSTEYEYLETHDAWLIERIKVLENLGCDKEQITWYCKKYAGYLDKNTIKQEYPITPDEAFISSGESVFDKEAISNQLVKISHIKPLKRGYFEYRKECTPVTDSTGVTVDVEWNIKDIKFVETQDGYITIHEEPRVKKDERQNVISRCPYVIGGDTAGTGEDYFTAKVIDNITFKTVATLHKQHIDEDLYAEQMYCLGKYYNDAFIGIEINYSRQPTRVLAYKYRYSNLYMRETVNRINDKREMDYGFDTNSKTRPIIIGDLVALMRDDPGLECDYNTLKEMTTFVKKDNGRQEAIDGAHDDLVMALAIAHFISKQYTHQFIDVIEAEDGFLTNNFHFDQGVNEKYISWEDF